MDELVNNMVKEGIDDIDRISYLPEIIIHHVMSFLLTKEVAKTSVLSKRWQRIQASYPDLDFDQTYFGEELTIRDPRRVRGIEKHTEIEEKRNKFIRFVDDTLSRFREQGLRIRKLKLYFTLPDSTMDSIVGRWIGLAIECMAEELDLQPQPPFDAWYRLPQTIFSAKPIKVLILSDCMLEQPLNGGSIRFPSLQTLSLIRVHVDVQVIENMISGCPLLEEFGLHQCSGLKKVQLSGLHNLKRVDVVQGQDEVERLDIEAPSLEIFCYRSNFFVISPCKFNLVACANLRWLFLTTLIITDQQFNDLISEFPLLEGLFMLNCNLLERVKIPNQCLKHLVLYCNKLVEVEIGASNLQSFQYDGNLMPSIVSTCSSGHWDAKLKLRSSDRLNSQWFHRMRSILAKTKHFKDLTLSIYCLENTFNVEELRDVLLPSIHVLEHVNLKLRSSSISYSALVDGLLWSCHPKTLSIEFDDLKSKNNFMKVLREKILHRFDLNCCHLRSIQCWQHGLKDIQCYDGDKRPLCWNTLADKFPTSQKHREIQITFKW